MEIKNYADLAAFIETLTPEQKQEKVIIQILDETSIEVTEMCVNDVDYFWNEDSEGLLPVDSYDPEHWDGKLLTDEDYNTIVPAGTRVFAYDDSFGEDEIAQHIIKPHQTIHAMRKLGFKVEYIGFHIVEFKRGKDKFRHDARKPISELFNSLISCQLLTSEKDEKVCQTAEGYIESVYGTRNFARALQLDDANSIMDMMNDFGNSIRKNKS